MPKEIFDTKEDIMWPKPTIEQIELWNEIEESLNEKNIELNVKFCNLSDMFRNHFASIKTALTIKTIGEKHHLQKNTIEQLSRIVSLILLGEINIIDFLRSVEKECNLERESARQLARDINSAIFLPVKDDLKEIHKISEWPRENENMNKNSNTPQLNGNIVNLKK